MYAFRNNGHCCDLEYETYPQANIIDLFDNGLFSQSDAVVQQTLVGESLHGFDN